MDNNQDYSQSNFFCFKLDDFIKDKGTFDIISEFSSELSHEIININDLTILRVYLKENLPSEIKDIKFKLEYKINKSDSKYKIPKEFTYTKGINFNYYIINNNSKIHHLFYYEQYIGFKSLNNFKDVLINNTLNIFKNFFDMDVFLEVMKDGANKKDEIEKIIDNISKLKMLYDYDQTKLYCKINEKSELSLLKENYQDKILIFYSVIQDSIEFLNDIKKESYEEIFKYNINQSMNQIHFKENTFKFFINNINPTDIKTLCKYCISTKIVFDYLLP